MKIIRARELRTIVGLSPTTVWRLERANQFPKRKKITNHSIGWMSDEVENWLASRKNAVDCAQGAQEISHDQ